MNKSQFSPIVRASLATIGVIAVIYYLYRDTLISMLDIWQRSETYAHGWVIVPISAWLIWRQRDCIRKISPAFNPWGLVLMAVSSLIWVAADIVGAQVVQHFTLVMIAVAAVLTIMGLQATRQLSFPLMFLIFAVPFGEMLIPVLMEFTATFTVAAVQISGIPVYRNGMFFALPSGDFEVAVACSGIRYLIASTALGTLFAYLSFRTLWKRAVFMLAAVLVPVLANGIRAYMIVMIAHFSNLKMAVGIDHFIYGWVFFGIVMFTLFLIGSRFQEVNVPRLASGASATAAGVATMTIAATLLVVIAVGVPASANALRVHGSSHAVLPELPRAAANWRGPLPPTLQYRPEFFNASTRLAARYVSAAGDVHVFVEYYSPTDTKAEMINDLNNVYGTAWIREDLGRRRIVSNTRHRVIETPLRRSYDELVVWHWYEIDGGATVSGTTVKLRKLWNTLTGRFQGSALVALAAAEDSSASRSTVLLESFVDDHLDRLRNCLQPGPATDDRCEKQ